MKMSTRRVIQLHCLVDDLASRARVCLRGAGNLERIGNARGALYQRSRGVRFQAAADRAQRLLEART